MINTILRRTVLCFTLIPLMCAFIAFSVVFIAPLMVFIGWVVGVHNPHRFVWEMMITDGPWIMVTDAWHGDDY